MHHRSGTILIIVAGISALLAGVSLAFLTRMRSDSEESSLMLRDAQARLMLTAACNYIQEAGRLGWDLPGTPEHEEGFGWIDVRDGFMGPRAEAYTLAEQRGRDPRTYPSPNFPVGTVARFPMQVWKRPPFALSQRVVFNPIQSNPASADFGMPYLRHRDPQPYIDPAVAGTPAAFADWERGDETVRTGSAGQAWFRVRRTGPARFTVTCGAGATRGFASWNEIETEDRSGREPGAIQSFGDRGLFEALLTQEIRLWYEVEWSPAVGGATYQCVDNEQGPDHYQWRPFNPVHEWYPGGHQSQPHARNMVGTIRWIQRLRHQPAVW